MESEFKSLHITYEREKPFDITYKQQVLPHKFIADYFVMEKMILEVKATTFIHTDAFRQTLNYLKASPHIQLGIIINFGTDSLESKRVILTTH